MKTSLWCLASVLVAQTQAVRLDGLPHQAGMLDERLRGGFAGAQQVPAPMFDSSRQERGVAAMAKKPRQLGRGPLHVAGLAPLGRPQMGAKTDAAGGVRRRILLFVTTLLRTAAVQVALLLSIFFLDPSRAGAGLVCEPALESPGPNVVYMDDWYHGGGAGRGTPDAEELTPHPHVTDYERGQRRKSEQPEGTPEERMAQLDAVAQRPIGQPPLVRSKSHLDFEKSEHIHPAVAAARAALFGAPETREPEVISHDVWAPGHNALGQDTWAPAETTPAPDSRILAEETQAQEKVFYQAPAQENVFYPAPGSADDAPVVKHKTPIGAIKDEIVSTWRAWAGAEGTEFEDTPVANVAATHVDRGWQSRDAPVADVAEDHVEHRQAPQESPVMTLPLHTSFYTRDDSGGGDHLLAEGFGIQAKLASTIARVSSFYSRGISSTGDAGLVQAHTHAEADLAIPEPAAVKSHVTECTSTRGFKGGDHAIVAACPAIASVRGSSGEAADTPLEKSVSAAAAATPSARESCAWESLSRDTSMDVSEMEMLVGNPSPEPSVESELEKASSKPVETKVKPLVRLGSSGSVPLVTHQVSFEEETVAEGARGEQQEQASGGTEELRIHPEVARAKALLAEQQREMAELLATPSPAGAAGEVAEMGGVSSRVSSVDFRPSQEPLSELNEVSGGCDEVSCARLTREHSSASSLPDDLEDAGARAASMRSLMLKAILGAIVYGQAEEVRTHVVQPALSFAGSQAWHGAKTAGAAGISLGCVSEREAVQERRERDACARWGCRAIARVRHTSSTSLVLAFMCRKSVCRQ